MKLRCLATVLYSDCCAVVSGISFCASRNFNLFGQVEADEKWGKDLEMVDLINQKYGRGTMMMAIGLIAKEKTRASALPIP